MNQTLNAKACEIAWKEQRFSDILLRMETFHTICNMLSIAGKRFGDAGLRDILIESQMVAEGSVCGVLDGKQHNRSVRAHRFVHETSMRLAWREVITWLDDRGNQAPRVHLLLERVNNLAVSIN